MTEEPPDWPDDGVILYGDVCVLCSSRVRFVAERDVERRFRFTPIESPYAGALTAAFGINPDDPDTNAVILDGRARRRWDATPAVLSTFPRWRWIVALRIAPRPLRDAVYALIARNRYRVFGRHDACDLGGPSLADRVIRDR